MRLFAMLASFALAAPAEEAKWEKKEFECERPERGCHIATCCRYGLAVFTREKPGALVREVKAVGQVDAPPERVFAVVTDYEHQVGNMPYVEKQQVFARTDKDVTFWAVADFPMVARRDWIVKSKLEKNLPGGVYRAAWDPVEIRDAPPPADGVVRLEIVTGSWTMEPIDGGKRTLATYQVLTDPGGRIPAFIANKANTTCLPELFARVRKRAEGK